MAETRIVIDELNFHVPILTVPTIDHAMAHRVAVTKRSNEPDTLRVLITPVGAIDGAIERQRQLLSATLIHSAEIGIVRESSGALIIKSSRPDAMSEDMALRILRQISEVMFGSRRWKHPTWRTLNWQRVGTILPPSNQLQLHKRQ